MEREKFIGKIWEPACGAGNISEILKSRGYEVRSTDLYDHGYGETGIDFMEAYQGINTLTEETDYANIVTNPPFSFNDKKKVEDFVEHALEVASRKVAIFAKLAFLEGKARRERLFNRKMLKNIYVFSNRVTFNGKSGGGE